VSSITTSEIQIDGSGGSSSSGSTSLKINQDSPTAVAVGGGAGSASEDDNVSNNGGSSQKVISPAKAASNKNCMLMISQPHGQRPKEAVASSGGSTTIVTCPSSTSTTSASATTMTLAHGLNSQPAHPKRPSPTLISIRRRCRRLSSSLSAEDSKSNSGDHPRYPDPDSTTSNSVDGGNGNTANNSSHEDLKNSILRRTRNKVVNAFK
jgi:hypothetical protein